jgi:hypothetical protein
MIDLDKLSDNDKILAQELEMCRDSYECYLIAEQAEDEVLKMEAHRKSVRLFHMEEYSAGLL